MQALHLLGLEPELGGIVEVLEAAAAAPAEVRARRLDAIRRGRLHGLDHAPAKAGSRFREPHSQTISRQPAADEHHVAVGAAHALAPEGQVVHGQRQNISASRARHP